MPVPVAVSGWKSESGGGVDAAPTVMETSGPFAALARRKAEMEAEAAAAGTSEVTVSTDAAPAKAEAEPIVETPLSEWGVAVNDLDWSYPSIDGSPIVGTEPLIRQLLPAARRQRRG